MTDTPPVPAEDDPHIDPVGERPDLGRTRDTLADHLTGTDVGSDTRSGSLRGGSASGSDDDPDQALINEALANQGRASKANPRQGTDDV